MGIEQSPAQSGQVRKLDKDIELKSDENSRVFTEREGKKEESVSELWRIVCKISEVQMKCVVLSSRL